jgi:hypothetical protein
MLLIWDDASNHKDEKIHPLLMRGGKRTVNYINSGCIGMIKPQRAQRTQRKRRERCIIPMSTD